MEFHYAQTIDNSRVARVADPARRREQAWLLLAAVVVFGLLFGYAWQSYRMIHLGYEIEATRRQETGLRQWNRALRLEQASLSDPVRIYRLASAQLGMESPAPGQVARLTPAAPAETTGAVMAEARRPAVGLGAEMGAALPAEISGGGGAGR